MSCIHGEKGLICMRCEESFDREVIEPSSELGDVDSMAKYYVRESNECEVMDDYIAHEQTFKAGHASRQQEVDALNVKVKELQNTIRAEEIKINHEDGVYQEATHYTWLDDQNELLQAQISTLTKQLDEVTNVKERYEEALEHIKLVLKDVQTPNNTLAIECFEEAKEALNGSSK